MTQLEDAIATTAREVERVMEFLLPKADDAEARVFQAMRYSCLGGGKRLRPFIVTQSAKMFAVDERCALRVGAAVEFLHCYSLIHDDLPAMDDSDLRRGRPSCHKKFDEATAILAGDGLQALAFEVLAAEETSSDAFVRAKLVSELAKAAGGEGMVGGQMIDLLAEEQEFDIGAITRMQRMKTGEIFAFAATSGAIMGHATDRHIHALHSFAQELGLAFQIADDLLDAVGDSNTTGKPVGQDGAAGKATFVSVLGIERARSQARLLAEQAARALDLFGERADLLKQVAAYVVDRTH
ncbi:polyprenyl synthetase family protein [uncultured Nisaea sp.]|jgi:farnesyl diphosphate synthase|uniref:polyprenyl synthetase family protein n=1 Tax=uncultured Nisaea sp. TaxID=538215 RepID=UPI0030EB7223|tara:strand:+ start:653 stop:1540 length:888 start_codon:yes stop_codon:yes gene_type:complete